MSGNKHSDLCVAAMPLFGGKAVQPPTGLVVADSAALQRYLDAVGVRKFRARNSDGSDGELIRVRPDKSETAARFGYASFLPPVDWWPRLALQALLADLVRDAAGSAVTVTNAWRPEDYNGAVGGGPESAHIQCCALDIRFASPEAWDRGVRLLLKLYGNDALRLNLGVGYDRNGMFCHIGAFDMRPDASEPRDKRRWRYSKAGAPVKWRTKNLPT